jgi:phospholipase/carboxylesterase
MKPHGGMPVLSRGASLQGARAAMIMIHGRGSSAEDILSLAEELFDPSVAYLAPQAAGGTWYPHTFLSPVASNEPGISSGLAVIQELADRAARAGVPSERLFVLGFSQGACLALEYAARNARRFGGVVGLSGGLIGAEGTPREYAGSFDGTPVFLGCSRVDPHIPEPRVRLTAEVFTRMGAAVTMRLYPAPGHAVNDDELDAVRALLSAPAV